jgi:hypothetical protein
MGKTVAIQILLEQAQGLIDRAIRFGHGRKTLLFFPKERLVPSTPP